MQALLQRGQFREAEQRCRQLLPVSPHTDDLLRLLVQIQMQEGRSEEAIDGFLQLIDRHPDQLHFYAHLADYLASLGRPDQALECYAHLLERQPAYGDAHYNLGLLLRRLGSFDQALQSFERALASHIAQPEEVHLNIGNIHAQLRHTETALQSFRKALQLNPNYIPAMYNVAGLLEETAEREGAVQMYWRILRQEPDYCPALSRLAHAVSVDSEQHPLIGLLRARLDGDRLEDDVRQDLLYALAKLLDDCRSFDAAFDAAAQANAIAARRGRRYDRAAAERQVDDIIQFFTPQWFEGLPQVSDAEPIFVCGMFRSGTTLVEQMLAGHPALTSGGELDYFPMLVRQRLQPFPAALRGLNAADLRSLADQYLALQRLMFPQAVRVTDKRPDNIWNLGLVRSLFPRAKLIATARHPLDTSLSIYFQQLSDELPYASSLLDIGHHYLQHRRLLQHWKRLFGDCLHEVNYDELVENPAAVLGAALAYCGLDWDERCLQFHRVGNAVNTASLWQVRQPLYRRSKGRWRGYERHLRELSDYLRQHQVLI